MRYRVGDFIYFISREGERFPGRVLAVKKRVKVVINHLEGDRVLWVSSKNLELQENGFYENL
jgi:hypothetical protein